MYIYVFMNTYICMLQSYTICVYIYIHSFCKDLLASCNETLLLPLGPCDFSVLARCLLSGGSVGLLGCICFTVGFSVSCSNSGFTEIRQMHLSCLKQGVLCEKSMRLSGDSLRS